MEIVAEAGTGHNGSLDKAYKLIDGAKKCGADCVKFQWIYADEILHKNTGPVNLPGGKISLYDRFKELQVDPDFYASLREYCQSINIKFMCSPFGMKSLHELLKIKPDYIKIASPELNYIQMLKELVEYNKDSIPVVLSSGVSKISDIEKALSIFKQEKNPINSPILLHCITQYPAPEEEYNVRLITNLKNIFGVNTGISDHSLNPELVPLLSLCENAYMIEKHITLDNQGEGLDDPVALNLSNFEFMVKKIKEFDGKKTSDILNYLSDKFKKEKIEKILGSGIKTLAPSEAENYGRTNRSLRFIKDLCTGSKICIEDIGILRTEKKLTPGLAPEFLDCILGAKLKTDVKSGQEVSWSSFF
ncbi:MAG: N-acetylneuraminate synthase family protein [Treponemataceae bacterium]